MCGHDGWMDVQDGRIQRRSCKESNTSLRSYFFVCFLLVILFLNLNFGTGLCEVMMMDGC